MPILKITAYISELLESHPMDAINQKLTYEVGIPIKELPF